MSDEDAKGIAKALKKALKGNGNTLREEFGEGRIEGFIKFLGNGAFQIF